MADARKVLDQHRRGATLVLQSLQRTWPAMVAWCGELEAELGWPVQANAYLSPPDQRGLARHADGHDVLAVQLHGTKRWWVDGLGDLTLTAGDVLYLPAGTEHVAETAEDPSLHLTIGIHRPTGPRLDQAALTLARSRLEAEVDGCPADERRSLLAAELGRVMTDEVLDRLRRPPRVPASGELAGAVRRGTLDPRSSIRASARWMVEVSPTDPDRIVLRWGHRRLHLPALTGPALHAVAEAGSTSLAIGSLPGLDDEDRLVLVCRLLDEGALEMHDAGVAAR